MSEEITVKEAAQLTDYSTEYVRELCRGGKVASRKFGTTLVVEKASLLAYKQGQDQKRINKDVSL